MAEEEPHPPTDLGEVTADRPRTSLDEDELGYREFAEAIASGLTSRAGDDGLVIAVHGKWGSGKTSAVNMVVDAVRRREVAVAEDSQTIIVRFNPWWFSEQQNLTRAFFNELNASIGRKLSSRVRDGLRTVAKKVTGATDLVAAALAWTPVGPLAKPIADAIKGAGEEIADERSLEDVRNDLAEALQGEKRNIVVIIDDVDRLVSDEIRQIFRLVKSVADLPRVTYLLVFDREIAARALERPSDPEGPEWLEKIVQASFDLPPVAQTDLNRLFLHRLAAIVGNEPVTDEIRWGNILHGAIAPWLRTARDVGRLANAIAMAWPAVKGEVDIPDFVAIETMRLFEPKLYEFVRNNPDKLTGAERMDGHRDQLEAFGNTLLSNVDESRRDRVRRALSYLFPRLDAIFANTWHGSDWSREEREKRISSKRRFPVYFSLGLGDGIISSAEFESLRESYADPRRTREIVRGYRERPRRTGGTRAMVLLNRLMAEAHDVPAEEAEQSARALLAAADLFFNPADGPRTPEDLPVRWAVSFAIIPLLEKLSPTTFGKLLEEAVDGPSPIFANYMVTRMSIEHGRAGDEKAKPVAERSLSLATVKRLEQRLAKRVARDAAAGVLIQSDEAAAIIYSWARIDGEQVVRGWIDAEFDKPGFAAWLMKSFTSEGTSHTFGDLVGKRIYTVNRESLATLLDVDRLQNMAEAMVADGKDTDDVATHFLTGLKREF